MAESYTYDGGALTTVRDNTTELTLSADHGDPGNGRFTIDDSDGVIEIIGQKDFSHEESACSIPLTFSGFISDRTYRRGATMNANARDIEVALVDLNAMLGFRLIDDEDGNRPRETIADRGAWILGSDYVTGLFTDEGRCDFSSGIEMTKSDYRNQYPGDVIADMGLAQGGGVNWHVNDYGDGPELTFRNDNTSTDDSSTLRISNVLADQTSVTLLPFKDATLTRSPGNVYSKIAFSNAKTTIYRNRTSTATAFNGERGGQASNSNVNTSEAARDAADDLLDQHSTEEDIIECTVLTTDAQVNLMPPGWRIQAKFSHLATEGYGSFTWFRILEVTKKPIVADDSLYEVRLKLSPQETFPVSNVCEDLYDPTPAGTYNPLGGGTIDGFYRPNDSDGVIYYWRGGYAYPSVPNPGYEGSWHFGVWGAGGAGTTDWAGDCTGNQLVLMTVGNGTWTIQTEQWPSGSRLLYVKDVEASTSTVPVYYGSVTSGDSIVVEIDDATSGDCIRRVAIGDFGGVCGGKWGFGGAVWVPA